MPSIAIILIHPIPIIIRKINRITLHSFILNRHNHRLVPSHKHGTIISQTLDIDPLFPIPVELEHVKPDRLIRAHKRLGCIVSQRVPFVHNLPIIRPHKFSYVPHRKKQLPRLGQSQVPLSRVEITREHLTGARQFCRTTNVDNHIPDRAGSFHVPPLDDRARAKNICRFRRVAAHGVVACLEIGPEIGPLYVSGPAEGDCCSEPHVVHGDDSVVGAVGWIAAQYEFVDLGILELVIDDLREGVFGWEVKSGFRKRVANIKIIFGFYLGKSKPTMRRTDTLYFLIIKVVIEMINIVVEVFE
ncbi:hypothetical protein CASFOL_029563 [Castilleja foliolosa]|uniref:Uncharacterized protein n=1 Tax=Castilleja foliolosa TaxID=1961234 RepID=A0ABD3C9F6_9LAMI